MPTINSLSLYQRIKLGLIKVHKRSPAKYRFLAGVNKNGPIHPSCDRCWQWTASVLQDGYGQFGVNGSTTRAHRYSWELYNGKIPDGLSVLHHCDNQLCVNPKHLFLGTHRQNMLDMTNKKRQAKGEQQHLAKLTTKDVLELRRLHKTGKFSRLQIAAMFGISVQNVGCIIKRYTWKHV